jgi:polyferredoxin
MSEDAARPVPARPLPLQTKKESASADGESWVLRIRWVALAVFAAVPLIGFSAPRIAGRVVWTIVIAALPLFIVLVGYHRWRRLCPLAFVNQIPVMLRRPGARRVPARIETNATYLSFAVFFLSLWARLVATNGSGSAIAFFFILIALAALVTGVLYTGKTWCNYVCPLAVIE